MPDVPVDLQAASRLEGGHLKALLAPVGDGTDLSVGGPDTHPVPEKSSSSRQLRSSRSPDCRRITLSPLLFDTYRPDPITGWILALVRVAGAVAAGNDGRLFASTLRASPRSAPKPFVIIKKVRRLAHAFRDCSHS